MRASDPRLYKLIEPVVDELGFELVRVRMTGSGTPTLQVMAERPDGTMTASDCAKLSRAISPLLEETDPIQSAYVLEVSSPGVDRPLTRLKDFERWEGFEAKIELDRMVENRKRFRGRLAGIEEEAVGIDLEGEEETAYIPFEWVADAKLVMTDDLMEAAAAAARPPANDDDETEQNDGEEE